MKFIIIISIFIFLLNFYETKIIENNGLIDNDGIITSSFFLTEWDIIGPFPSAPREDVDVLDAFGGIDNIPRASNLKYPSDLDNDGMVGWIHMTTDSSGMINLNYSETVNWDLITNWAGASGTYFSGWGLSDFTLQQDETIIISCSGVAKFFVDGNVMQGDSYGLGKSYNSISLSSGTHTVKVRIIGEQGASYQCLINQVGTPKEHSMFIVDANTVLPDVVDNQLASPYVSISILNLCPNPITNLSIEAPGDYPGIDVNVAPKQFDTVIGVGQLMSITLNVQSKNSSGYVDCPPGTVISSFLYVRTEYSTHPSYIALNFTCKSFGEPYKFTFLDYDNSVQYADAIPPNGAQKCEYCSNGCPVLLALHGAGVDANTRAWTTAYQSQNYSWILLPTNRANYGFDWEEGGIVDAFFALDYLCNQLPGVTTDKNSYSCDQNQLIISSHSMGGHGAWHLASAVAPDRIVSLSVAAGWIDMKLYSPNFLRLGYSWSHPKIRYILDSAISENDADLHSPHLINIPTIIRYATGDTNVPPTHLRRMSRLIDQLNHNSSTCQISPVVSNDHWFPGIVDDPIMQAFISKYELSGIPLLPNKFLINCLNPGTFQGKGGISILLATENFKISKIKVDKSSNSGLWVLQTENIQRFGFNKFQEFPSKLSIDGQSLPYVLMPSSHYCKLSNNNQWTVCTDNSWQLNQRSPSNTGPMVKILNNPILIVYGTIGNEQQTTQREQLGIYLSNVLGYQMNFAIPVLADTEFTNDLFSKYNVIFMGGPNTNKAVYSIESILPIGFSNTNVDNSPITFSLNGNTFSTSSTGALFLSPCYSNSTNNQRIGCMITVIEGTDSTGFQNAVFAFPTKSSSPMPDYMILGPNSGYQGVAGSYALGFWNNNWQYQDSLSYVTSILND